MTLKETPEFIDFSTMSPETFSALGVGEVAYVKTMMGPDETAYAIFGADGRQLATVSDREIAFTLIAKNNMEGVSLH